MSSMCATTRLDFGALQICGRECERFELEEARERLKESREHKEVIWISGHSGAGKSALVRNVFMNHERLSDERTQEHFFAQGKFEQLGSSKPYSALVDACGDMCLELRAQSEAQRSRDVDRLDSVSTLKMSSEDAKILKEVIPRANLMFPDRVCENEMNSDDSHINASQRKLEWSFERLKLAFVSFFRTACQILERVPLVVFLDDVQWADCKTSEIIKAIVVSEDVKGLLLVMASRVNDTIGSTSLFKAMKEESSSVSSKSVVWTEMKLGNLTRDEVESMIEQLTNHQSCEGRSRLINLIFHKTQGNPLYILHFIRQIEEKGFFYFSVVDFRWHSDLKSIRNYTEISNNAAGILTRTIKDLPEGTKDILKIAACLGSSFELDKLQSIVRLYITGNCPKNLGHISNHDSQDVTAGDDDFFFSDLNIAHRQGLIDYDQDENKFCFEHDRIQQASYDLLEEGTNRDTLHYQIGLLLRCIVGYSYTSPYLLKYLRQLNQGAHIIKDSEEKIELASLNLLAAKRMCQKSSFELAAQYLNNAKELIGEEHLWSDEYYRLSLDVISMLVEVQFSCGDLEDCLVNIRQIYTKAKRDSPSDLYRAQFMHLETLASMDCLSEAIDVGHSVLAELGEGLPRNPGLLSVIINTTRVNRALSRLGDNDILSLPTMKQAKKLAVMRNLGFLAPTAYFAQEDMLLPIYSSRMLELSLRFGACEHTAYALALFGFGASVIFDFDRATRCAKLALKMMERFQREDQRTMVVVHGLVYLLRKPLGSNFHNQLHTYQLALDRGDMKFAGQACTIYSMTAYVSGSIPLETLAHEVDSFLYQLDRNNQHLMYVALSVVGRAIVMISGSTYGLPSLNKCCQLSDQDFAQQCGASELNASAHWYQTMATSFLLDYFELALIRAEKAWATKGLPGAQSCTNMFDFFSALVALQAYKNSGKRRYWRIYRKCYRSLQNWFKRGYPNNYHFILMLDAEMLIFRKRRSAEVKAKFDQAIEVAQQTGGFIQDTALAYERAGNYFVRRRYHRFAFSYIHKARERFRQWGAVAKARLIETKYGLGVTEALDVHQNATIGRLW